MTISEEFDSSKGTGDLPKGDSAKANNQKMNVRGPLCVACIKNELEVFQTNEIAYQALKGQERIDAMNLDLHQMDLVPSYYNGNLMEVLEKKIKFEKEKIGVADNQSHPKNENLLIPKGARKLEVDLTESELAEIIGKALCKERNSKENQIYKGGKAELAEWICNSFLLSNGHEITLITIKSQLPTDVNMFLKKETHTQKIDPKKI